MYAVVDIAGQQVKVAKDDKVYVNRLDAAEGAKVDFDRVLMVDDNGKVAVGAPVVEGASVKATVITHLKDKKITVFKKKRRKGYQKSNGHRQSLTQIKIEGISLKAGKAKAAKADSAEAPAEG